MSKPSEPRKPSRKPSKQELFRHSQDYLQAHIDASLQVIWALDQGDQDDIDEARAEQILTRLEAMAALREFGFFEEETPSEL